MTSALTHRHRRSYSSTRSGRRPAAGRRHDPAFETFEDRTLLSVTASLIPAGGPGQLHVLGDNLASSRDVIDVRIQPGNAANIEVDANGASVGSFSLAAVTSIVVDTGAGSDTVNIDDPNGEFLAIPMTLRGGGGDNTFNPGYGTTVLDGGTGNSNLGLPTQLVVSVGTAISSELSKLQGALVAAAYQANSLPFIGSQLQNVPDAQVFADFQSQLGSVLNEVANPPDIQKLIYDVLGPDSVPVNGSTAGTGLNLLGDTNGDQAVNVSDVLIAETRTLTSASYTVETKLARALAAVNVPLNLQVGLSGLPLNLTTTGGMQASVGFSDDLEFGVSLGTGNTQQVGLIQDPARPDLNTATIAADVSLTSDFAATGTLGLVQVSARQDPDPARASSFDASIAVHLTDTSATATLTGEAKLNLDLSLDLGIPGTSFDVALGTLFSLDWGFGGDSLSSAASSFGTAPTVEFSDVTLDLGTFVSSFAEPIIQDVQKYLAPIQPVVSALTANIPGLSKIGIDLSLVTLIDTFEPQYAGPLNAFLSAYNQLENLTFDANAGIKINLGSFGTTDARDGSAAVQGTSAPSKTPDQQAVAGEVAHPKSTDFLKQFLSGAASDLAFPLLENPSNVFGMLLGQTETLVTLTLPQLTARLDFSEPIPLVDGLLNLVVGGGVGITANLAFGYDTTGLKEFEADSSATTAQKAADLFDGFYISNRQLDGAPDADPQPNDGSAPGPQFILSGELSLGLALGPDVPDLAQIDASITGLITLDAYFTLHDKSSDGRIRYKELEADITNAVNDPAHALNYIFDTTVEIVGSVVIAAEVDVLGTAIVSYSKTIASDTLYTFSTGTIGGVDPSTGLLMIAPTAQLNAPAQALEGQANPFALSVTGTNNPNPQDTLQYTLDVSHTQLDARDQPVSPAVTTDDVLVDGVSSPPDTTYYYDDGPADLVVHARVTDPATGLYTDYYKTVVVANVSPVSGLVNNGPLNVGQSGQVAFSNTAYAPLPGLHGTGSNSSYQGNPTDPYYATYVQTGGEDWQLGTRVVYNPGTYFPIPNSDQVISGSPSAYWIGLQPPGYYQGDSTTQTRLSTSITIDPANLENAEVNLNITTAAYGNSGAFQDGTYDYQYQPQRVAVYVNGAFIQDVPMLAQGPTHIGDGYNYGFVHAGIVPLTPEFLRTHDNTGQSGLFHVDIVILGGVDGTSNEPTTPVEIYAKVGVSGTFTPAYTSDPSIADAQAGFQYSYDFQNDGSFTDPGDLDKSSFPSASLPASIVNSVGAHVVHGRVYDKDGGYNDYYTTVVVGQGDAGLVMAGSPYTIYQGQSLTLHAYYVGSGSTYDWDIQGTSEYRTTTTSPTLTLTWAQAKPYLSDAGSNGSAIFNVSETTNYFGLAFSTYGQIVVLDTPPTSTLSGASASALQPYNVGFTVSDPGVDQVNSWVVHWGDGTANQVTIDRNTGLATETAINGTTVLSTAAVTTTTDASGNTIDQFNVPHVYQALGTFSVSADGFYQVAGGPVAGLPVEAGPLSVAVVSPYAPPSPTINVDDKSPFAGDWINATAGLTHAFSGLTYQDSWSLYLGTSATPVAVGQGQDYLFQVPTAGNYTLKLVATDSLGQTGTTTTPVRVAAEVTQLVNVSASGTYGGAGTVTATLQVHGLPLAGQLVKFVLPGTPVVFATTDANGVATVSGVSMAEFHAGVDTGVLSVSYAGTNQYAPTAATGTLTVGKAQLTVTALNETTIYGTAATLGDDISGFVNGDSLRNGSIQGAPTLTTTDTATSRVSSTPYPVTAGIGTLTSLDYDFSFQPGLVVVLPHQLTVTVGNAFTTYGIAASPYTDRVSGLQNGDTISVVLPPVVPSSSPVGQYPIVPTVAPSRALANYQVTVVPGTLTVVPAPLTVAVADESTTYGTAAPVPTATVTGVQNGDLISVVFLQAVSPTAPVGQYPLTPAVLAGNGVLSNYTLMVHQGTLTVTPAPLTVTVADETTTYGTGAPVPTATVTGVQNGDLISVVFLQAVSPTAPVGQYPLTPSVLAGNGVLSNYTVTVNPGTLTVTPAPLTVTVADETTTYGTAAPTPAATVTGLENGDAIAVRFPVFNPGAAVGQYALTPSVIATQGSLSNYTLTVNPGTLTVTAASLTVQADNLTRTYGAANPSLTYSFRGFVLGQSVTTSDVSGTPVLSVSANVTSPVGNYPISIGLGTLASRNYTFVTQAGILSVTQATPTFTLSAPGSTYDGTPYHSAAAEVFGPNATDLGSATLTYYAGSDAALTSPLAGPPSNVGSYLVVASYAGDSNDAAAFSPATGFAITRRATTTTLTLPTTPTVPGQPLPVSATVATGLAGLFVPAGETVQFTVDGQNYGSPVAVGSSGTASTLLTNLTPGSHTVGAVYSGDLNFAGSSGSGSSSAVLSPGVYAVGTTLYVIGTNKSDDAAVGPLGGKCDGTTGLIVAASIGGQWSLNTFKQAFTAIVIDGYDGSDSFLLDPSLRLTTTVVEGNGNDYLLTGSGTDTITMGNGNDVVQGICGNKTVTLGNGNDSVQFGGGNHVITLGNGNNNIGTGDGTDSVSFGTGNNSVSLDDGDKTVIGAAGTGNNYVSAGDGNDTVTLGGGNHTVRLGDGSDTLTLGDGNNSVSAGDGNDTVTVGNGNNAISLGNGDDVVVEGNGNDSVYAGNGADLVIGGLGQHTIRLGSGNDILIDGSVSLMQAGDSLRTVLTDWKASATTAVNSRLKVTYNTTHPNALHAGKGRDWFFFTNPKDSTNRKGTDRLN